MPSHRPALALAFLLFACDTAAPEPDVHEPKTRDRAKPAASACNPSRELSALDPRKPVPLLPMMAWHQKQNMMAHLVAVQQITARLAEDDWSGVAEAASTLESSTQMQQMCEHMGAGAPGFTEAALDFHQRADAIGPAARDANRAAVLVAVSRTLEACTDCHATYRQEVRCGEDDSLSGTPAHPPIH